MNIELSSMSTPSVCKLPAWITVASTLDAIRLIELGARAGMVCQLTGIDKTNANRLYRQIHQRPSPPGQAPFTDSWYLKTDYRMLHASLAWRLFQRYEQPDYRAAQMVIEVYECYLFLVQAPWLDITHVAYVPQLMRMRIWKECVCQNCHTRYRESDGQQRHDLSGVSAVPEIPMFSLWRVHGRLSQRTAKNNLHSVRMAALKIMYMINSLSLHIQFSQKDKLETSSIRMTVQT